MSLADQHLAPTRAHSAARRPFPDAPTSTPSGGGHLVSRKSRGPGSRSRRSKAVQGDVSRARKKLQNSMRRTAQGMTQSERYRNCAVALVEGASGATFYYAGQGHAGVSGVQTCQSIWVCPVCAPKILARRSAMLAIAARRWVDAGHGLVMLTPTVSHYRHESLALVAGIENAAWKATISDKAYKGVRGLKATYDVEYVAWGRELNHGDDNGWHPHRHVLLFLDNPLTDAQLEALRSDFYSIWERKVVKLGGRTPHHVHGVNAKQVTTANTADAAGLAAYVAKGQVSGLDGLAKEITLGQYKQGAGSVSTFGILARIDAAKAAGQEPDAADVARWKEYVEWVDGPGGGDLMSIPPKMLKAMDVTDEDITEEMQAQEGAADDTEPTEDRIGVLFIEATDWYKIARDLELRTQVEAAIASGRDKHDARLRGMSVLASAGIGYQSIDVLLRPDDGDDGLPTHTVAFARDLAAAVLAV